MTYFTGNIRYERQGLLNPRKSTETVPQIASLNTLRFIAVFHFLLGKYFVGNVHPGRDSEIREIGRNLKTWGFTQANFLFILSGFVLAMNYAPTLSDGVGPGYSVKKFLIKRICWLYPTYLISLYLRVWDHPSEYTGKFRYWLKFIVNAVGIAGYWPPSFRTYHVNNLSWMVTVFLTMYLIVMPIFLKPIHRLKRDSRKILLVCMWPWTMFVGFVVERFDILSNDGTTHWDWNNPILYIASFVMGLTAGSVFVDRDVESEAAIGIGALFRRFGGTVLFLATFIVMCQFNVEPMYHWHQVGSLSLLQALMIYAFANGRDLILGNAFSAFPVRVVSGYATVSLIISPAIHEFAKKISGNSSYSGWHYDVTFLTSLIAYSIIFRIFIEIPYARWALHYFGSKEA